jgi:hypothetical protein
MKERRISGNDNLDNNGCEEGVGERGVVVNTEVSSDTEA